MIGAGVSDTMSMLTLYMPGNIHVNIQSFYSPGKRVSVVAQQFRALLATPASFSECEFNQVQTTLILMQL